MIRILALNDSSSEEEGNTGQVQKSTKEAQETEAHTLYNNALTLQRQGDLVKAEQSFHQLLSLSLITQAAPLTSEDEGLVHPGLVLKYSAYKNLASMAAQRGDYNTAVENYLEAVTVDASDVTVWYKLGSAALKIHHYTLSKFAFEQGLECNPKHWPCLDNVVTVMYALNNYAACLIYIARALERDSGYTKGLVLREQIFKEQPSFRQQSADLFNSYDDTIFCPDITQEEIDEYVQEALQMRERKRKICKPPDLPVLTFTQPLSSFTWKCLGDCLVALYDNISSGQPHVKYSCRVDMSLYASMNPAIQMPPVALASESAPILSMETTPVVTTNPSPAPVDTSTTLPQITPTAVPTGVPMDLDHMSYTSAGRGRGQKRKRMAMDDTCKRRSARVRNTNKRKQDEVVNYQDLLLKFLPSSLLPYQDMEDDDWDSLPPQLTPVGPEPCALDNGTGGGTNKGSEASSPALSEQTDVHHFIRTHQNNSGIIDLLNEYLITLARQDDTKWAEGVVDVYVNAYQRVREHILYPPYLCKDVPDERIRDMAKMCLILSELKLDKWLSSRSKNTPSASPHKNSSVTVGSLGPDFPGEYYTEDLGYMVGLTCCPHILGDWWQEYCIRVLWLKARFLVLQNKMDFAVDCFNETSRYLSYEENGESSAILIKLQNCRVDRTISLGDVTKQLESLQRCQSLEEVQRLHDAGNHERVVDLLLQTFKEPQQAVKGKAVELGIPERHAQLLLLQGSLLKLNDYQRCLLWGEVSFSEALQKYMGAPTNTVKDEWVTTMTQLLEGLDKCLSKDSNILKTLPAKNLVRLAQNLIKTIEIAMDVPESATDMAIGTLLPWVLLYRLIRHEEKKLRDLLSQEKGTGSSEALDECLPSSLMLLNIAHEYLGRRSFCVNSDGALLLFMVKVFFEELNTSSVDSPHPFKEDLEQGIEQCFYCMYGHPNKKTKAKHLQDHNVSQIPLTWKQAVKVFEYFKPKTVPEFDSYKTSTVSGELENLLRRISMLVPTQANPANTIDSVTSYIEGATNQPPGLPENKPVTLPVVKELYYLLADYYFKNKEQAKAIKFYMHDICVNPGRFDSWAGMALARMSRLEQKLNSHELKTEAPIGKHSIAALRCFKRALEIDDSNGKLWIEYGSLAYQLHSHASRQLKQQNMHTLGKEMLEIAHSNCSEMLKIAQNCYRKASQCEADGSEEEWLHHYMLGKVAEKMKRPLHEYLDHYKQAVHHLHEDYARYPKKITYIYSPPHLAVESLEVYYRIHAAILKQLLKHIEQATLLEVEKYLKEAAEGPFANNCEKKAEKRDRLDSSMTTDESSCPGVLSPTTPNAVAPLPVAGKKSKPTYHAVPQDHEYSKQRSFDSSGRSSAEENSMDQSKETTMVRGTGLVTPGGVSVSSGLPTHSASVSPATTATVAQTKEVFSPFLLPSVSAVNIPTPAPSAGSFSMANILGDVITKHLLSDGQDEKTMGTLLKDPLSQPRGPTIVKDQLTLSAGRQEQPMEFMDSSQVKEDKQPQHSVIHNMSQATVSTPQASNISHTVVPASSTDSNRDLLMGTDRIKQGEVQDTKSILPDLNKDNSNGGSRDNSMSSDMFGSAATVIEQETNLNTQDEESEMEVNTSLETNKSDSDFLTDLEMACKKVIDPSDKESNDELDREDSHSQDQTAIKKSVPMDEDQDSIIVLDNSEPNTPVKGPSTSNLPKEKLERAAAEMLPKLIINKTEAGEDTCDVKHKTQMSDQIGKSCDSKLETGNQGDRNNSSLPSSSVDVKKEESECLENQSSHHKGTATQSSDQSQEPGQSADMSTNQSEQKVKPVDQSNAQNDDEKKEQTQGKLQQAEGDTKELSKEEFKKKHAKLLDMCISAMCLCLSRFPQHYKSLYHLAKVYFQSPFHKDVNKARDLLLGTHKTPWNQLPHMPSPGLFQDRKQTNFFNGLWRIPIEEIDRSGSFASHLLRSLQLAYRVLEEAQDSKNLFFIHQQLQRSPDQGRKYLRDNDRIYMAKEAYSLCLKVLEEHLNQKGSEESWQKFLLEVYRVWQHTGKQVGSVERVNNLLAEAYRQYRNNKLEEPPSALEQAIRYCQQIMPVTKQLEPGQTSPATPTIPSSPLKFPKVPDASSSMSATQSDSLHITDPSKLTTAVQAKVPKLPSSDMGEGLKTRLYSSMPLSPSRSPTAAVRLGTDEARKIIRPCSVRLGPGSPKSPSRSRSPSVSMLGTSPKRGRSPDTAEPMDLKTGPSIPKTEVNPGVSKSGNSSATATSATSTKTVSSLETLLNTRIASAASKLEGKNVVVLQRGEDSSKQYSPGQASGGSASKHKTTAVNKPSLILKGTPPGTTVLAKPARSSPEVSVIYEGRPSYSRPGITVSTTTARTPVNMMQSKTILSSASTLQQKIHKPVPVQAKPIQKLPKSSATGTVSTRPSMTKTSKTESVPSVSSAMRPAFPVSLVPAVGNPMMPPLPAVSVAGMMLPGGIPLSALQPGANAMSLLPHLMAAGVPLSPTLSNLPLAMWAKDAAASVLGMTPASAFASSSGSRPDAPKPKAQHRERSSSTTSGRSTGSTSSWGSTPRAGQPTTPRTPASQTDDDCIIISSSQDSD